MKFKNFYPPMNVTSKLVLLSIFFLIYNFAFSTDVRFSNMLKNKSFCGLAFSCNWGGGEKKKGGAL